MGNTHFRSNVLAEGSSVTASFPTMKTDTLTVNTTLTMPSGTAVTNPNCSGGSYLKLNANSYIIWGTADTAAGMEAAATALTTVSTPLGCVYICLDNNTASGGWFFRRSTAASWLNIHGVAAA